MYRYPDYIFYGDATVAQSAQLNSRYGTESLKGVLLDIHFLSLCDYLVCTFSSQVKKELFLSIKMKLGCEI
jgi:glycoprotein 6-alpha-L-fucosyltransferase